jgi:hypothetical protein
VANSGAARRRDRTIFDEGIAARLLQRRKAFEIGSRSLHELPELSEGLRFRPMHALSTSSPKNVTTKIHRSREIVSRKWVAYQELISSETNYSQRVAAKVLKIPRSTFQCWCASHTQDDELLSN